MILWLDNKLWIILVVTKNLRGDINSLVIMTHKIHKQWSSVNKKMIPQYIYMHNGWFINIWLWMRSLNVFHFTVTGHSCCCVQQESWVTGTFEAAYCVGTDLIAGSDGSRALVIIITLWCPNQSKASITTACVTSRSVRADLATWIGSLAFINIWNTNFLFQIPLMNMIYYSWTSK
jgi:hypothetical protein